MMSLSLFALIFRRLPTEITRGLIENWLTLEDIGRTDSACCQKEFRGLFLSAIAKTFKIGASLALNGKFGNYFVNWSLSREMLYSCKKLVPVRRQTDSPSDCSKNLDWNCERNSNLIFSNDIVSIHIASIILSVLTSESCLILRKEALPRDVLNRLLELFRHNDKNIVLRSLCSGNYIGKGTKQIQVALECNCLPAMVPLLDSCHAGNIRVNAAWAIGNMTYGTALHIQAVFDTGVVPKLMKFLLDSEVLWESNIVRTMLNITARGSHAHVMNIVDEGVVTTLCGILAGHSDDRTSEALRALSNILIVSGKLGKQAGVKSQIVECGGLVTIGKLQIQYGVANEVIRRYFSE